MLYTIENEYLKLKISSAGAEMHSVFNKKNALEYLWNGDDRYWNGHAYNLFPFCGRLWESRYTYKGREYKMGLHGFARNSIFTVNQQKEDKISFILCDDDSTYAIYPFKFRLTVIYSLIKNKIVNEYTVENLGDNKMYYSLGAHPGFFVPLQPDEVFDDYYIEFETPQTAIEKLKISESGYLLHGTETCKLKDDRIIPLTHELFAESNFYVNADKKVAMRSHKSERAVILTYPDMKYLGLWQVYGKNAPYLCIEPWYGSPSFEGKTDDIETKSDMLTLDSSEVRKTYITFEME